MSKTTKQAYLLTDFEVSNEDLINHFKTLLTPTTPRDILTIFELNLINKELFPKIKLSSNPTWQNYLTSWINKYTNAHLCPPSKKIATPSDAPNDYLVSRIVQTALALPEKELSDIQKYHSLAMQVENIQGGLLEEYIASKVHKCDWIWCKGETVRSVDFCTKDCKTILQIKNKYNTENSSSSSVREGTNILKWYRLGKKKSNGTVFPVFKWDDLNKIIIENGNGANPELSEADYEQFIINVVANNKEIIAY